MSVTAGHTAPRLAAVRGIKLRQIVLLLPSRIDCDVFFGQSGSCGSLNVRGRSASGCWFLRARARLRAWNQHRCSLRGRLRHLLWRRLRDGLRCGLRLQGGDEIGCSLGLLRWNSRRDLWRNSLRGWLRHLIGNSANSSKAWLRNRLDDNRCRNLAVPNKRLWRVWLDGDRRRTETSEGRCRLCRDCWHRRHARQDLLRQRLQNDCGLSNACKGCAGLRDNRRNLPRTRNSLTRLRCHDDYLSRQPPWSLGRTGAR